MKFIYCGKISHNAAYAMAAIHIGAYKKEELPCFQDILKQWELCCLYGSQKGNLIYMGLDENLQEVCIIGRGNHGSMVEKAYKGLDSIYKLTDDNHFIHVDRWEGIIPIMLKFSTKYPSLKSIGKGVFIYWFKKNYSKWVQIVEDDKQKQMKG